MTNGNLAKALDDQGKYSDAEAEERAVLKLQENVLGPEHPDTLRTRDDLAGALEGQSKHRDAESEYRAVLKLKEKVLGPDHPDTKKIRKASAGVAGEDRIRRGTRKRAH
jgi:hypothetical protein